MSARTASLVLPDGRLGVGFEGADRNVLIEAGAYASTDGSLLAPLGDGEMWRDFGAAPDTEQIWVVDRDGFRRIEPYTGEPTIAVSPPGSRISQLGERLIATISSGYREYTIAGDEAEFVTTAVLGSDRCNILEAVVRPGRPGELFLACGRDQTEALFAYDREADSYVAIAGALSPGDRVLDIAVVEAE